jgi:hypothetical protein
MNPYREDASYKEDPYVLTVRVPGGMKSELERIANSEERSVAGQVRHLIRTLLIDDYDRRLAELERS